ncbi:glycoside hydrolase family 16 protein [Trichoderma evansii]
MAYFLDTSYAGEALLSGFNWFDGVDPSHGFVAYQNRQNAEQLGLYDIDHNSGVVRIGVDSTHRYSPGDRGRPSIRLESKETYEHGLFIADFLHMPPSHCGLWPAFWTYGDNWPYDGEIDIIEGVNTAHTNIISAHTSDGCTQGPSINGLYSGQQLSTQCAVGTDNIGCGFNPSPDDTSSYGDGFNAAHGGVYAMEWNEANIRIWHFPRGSIPRDIENKEPDPDSWGQPVAIFGGSSCDVDTYFKNMRLVLNINFCGDYGNAVWGKTDTCNQFAPTCAEYVGGNPEAFTNAFWDVRYIDAYQFRPGNRNPRPDHPNRPEPDRPDRPGHLEPTTTTTMTTRVTETVTVFGPGNLHRPPFTNNTRGSNAPHFSNDTHGPQGSPITVTVVPIEPVATRPPVNPIKIKDYAYLGCFHSSSDFKSFPEVDSRKDMTLERCIDLCDNKKYVGVFDTHCFCGDHIDSRTGAAQKEGLCNHPCPGNNRELCGGIIRRGGDGEGRLPGMVSNSSSPFALTVYGCVAEEKPKAPPAMAPGSNEVAPKAYPHKPPTEYSRTTTTVAEVTIFPVSEQEWHSHNDSSWKGWNGNGWQDDGKQDDGKGEENSEWWKFSKEEHEDGKHNEDGEHKDYNGGSSSKEKEGYDHDDDHKWKWNPAKPEITEVVLSVTKTVTDCPESTTTKEHIWLPPTDPKEHWGSVPPFGPLPPSPTPAEPEEHWATVPPFWPLPPSSTPGDPKENWGSVPPFGPLPPSPTPPPPHDDFESHHPPYDGDDPNDPPSPPPLFQTGAHPPHPPVVVAAAPGNHEGKEKYLVIMGLSILAVVMGVL